MKSVLKTIFRPWVGTSPELGRRLDRIEQMNRKIKMKVNDLIDALTGVKEQLDKARTELLGKIDELSNAQLPPEVSNLVQELRDRAASLDGIVPDIAKEPDPVIPPPPAGEPEGGEPAAPEEVPSAPSEEAPAAESEAINGGGSEPDTAA